MTKYEINFFDLAGSSFPKNFQKINTIEIRYKIYLTDEFGIEYNFHQIDFDLWLGLLETHQEDVTESYLINEYGQEINTPEKFVYNHYVLVSKDINLHRNINLIPYLFNKETNWDNMHDQIELNTWNS